MRPEKTKTALLAGLLFFVFCKQALGFGSKPSSQNPTPSERPDSTEQINDFEFSSRNVARNAILGEAQDHIGEPYVYGASGPHSFDCSGFVYYVHKRVLGINQFSIGRTNARGYADYLQGQKARVDCKMAQPADIIFFAGGEGGPYVDHIVIMTQPKTGTFVGAQSKKSGVSTASIYGQYWKDRKARCYTNTWADRAHVR